MHVYCQKNKQGFLSITGFCNTGDNFTVSLNSTRYFIKHLFASALLGAGDASVYETVSLLSVTLYSRQQHNLTIVIKSHKDVLTLNNLF